MPEIGVFPVTARRLADRACELASMGDPGALSDAELLDAVGAVGELHRLLDVVTVALAGEVDGRSLGQLTGERDTATLLALSARLDPPCAPSTTGVSTATAGT